MPKSRNRRSNGKTKKQPNQEAANATGTLLGVRQGMRSAASASPDRYLRVVAWIAVGLVGLFLTLALLIP